MKIKSYVERDGMLVVQTDFKAMPEFVYHADRFESLDALKAEILRKCSEYTLCKQRKADKTVKLKLELDKEVKDNARD